MSYENWYLISWESFEWVILSSRGYFDNFSLNSTVFLKTARIITLKEIKYQRGSCHLLLLPKRERLLHHCKIHFCHPRNTMKVGMHFLEYILHLLGEMRRRVTLHRFRRYAQWFLFHSVAQECHHQPSDFCGDVWDGNVAFLQCRISD